MTWTRVLQEVRQMRFEELYERRQREGYRHKPVKRGEFSAWEHEQAWGDR